VSDDKPKKKYNYTSGKRPGQPTKYRPEYCQELVEFMAKGYSIEAFAGHIRVTADTVYEWCRVHKEFSEAKKEGTVRCREFYEKIGLAGATGQLKNFNVTAWIFNMKNRFGWRDKHEIEHQGNIQPIVIERPSGDRLELKTEKK
jgi:hypothetical protein